MHTRLEPDNPYGCNRYGFAWHHVPAGGAAHLDFGCGDGRFLKALRSKNIKCLIGVDIGREAIRQAEQASGGLEIMHIEKVEPLPFPDGLFSSITLMDVLEHVDEQEVLLDELYRVLSDDGTLIVTVPGRHALSFLDLGNLKFRFPRVHRWYYSRQHSRQAYLRRYVSNPDGLIGDVASAKRWHEHFSRPELQRLLDRSRFTITAFDGTGYFTRILKIADLLAARLGPIRSGVRRIMAWDARRFASANLFCIARKCRVPWPADDANLLHDHDATGHNVKTTDPQYALQRLGADE
jgi:SAM-dependent methyltransferase